MDAAQKVKDSFAANDGKRLVKVPKVSFDRFTDQTNAGLAKVLWSSKVIEAKAGSLIVSKIKECVPTPVLQYKTGRGLEIPSTSCDVEEFADFFVNTLGRMVAPSTEEAFYKPQRMDHNGKPRQQDGKVAKVSVKKVKFVTSSASKRPTNQEIKVAKVDVRKVKPRMPACGKPKSHAGVNRVQNPKTY